MDIAGKGIPGQAGDASMSFEKFVHRNLLVADCVQRIAASGKAGHLFEHSARFNPRVRELLAAQERLLNAAERLLEHCDSTEAQSA